MGLSQRCLKIGDDLGYELFQCPEGLEWDCHIRKPRTLVSSLRFQCPEGLEWDCHQNQLRELVNSLEKFQCPEGLEWDCHN